MPDTSPQTRMQRIIRILLVVAFIGWMVGWSQALGFSFSSSFFRYHSGSRLPILVMALLAVAVPPLSGYWAVTRTIRKEIGAIKACFINLVISGLPLVISWSVLTLWIMIARRAGKLAFEADDAMGIGIQFLFCQAAFLASNLAVVCIVVVWNLLKRNSRDA